jgi:glyoxylase-like metal-dependent hydrolase (beta-lactamase superfamily II)
MATFTTIDLNWMGRPRSIAALLIESAGSRALVDPGPESTLPSLRAGLTGRGLAVEKLDAILLTHIHLDHAGATGALLQENPSLKVYVHEFGAVHMIDPSRLLASAGRLYGGDLLTLYGECKPVPEGNLRPLLGGENVRIGETELETFYTPGHASHHLTFWDGQSQTAFVGDTAGIRVQGDTFLLPATPPPDIDVAIWNQSLDAIASRGPERIFLTHFGFIENPSEHIRLYKMKLEEWTELTRSLLGSGVETNEAEKAFVETVAAEITSTLPRDAADHYIFNAGLRLSWLGLMRYVTKKTQPPRPPTAA